MENLLFHWGLEGSGSKVFRVSKNGSDRIVRRYSYMDFDENDDEIWRQGEIEHPSFDVFWQEATVNKKWFSRHPVYIHDECKPVIRKSIDGIDMTGLTETELLAVDGWKKLL